MERVPCWLVDITDRMPVEVRRLWQNDYPVHIAIGTNGNGFVTVRAKDELGAYTETLKLIAGRDNRGPDA